MDLSIKSPAVDTYRIEMTSHSSDLLLYTPLLLVLYKASQSSRASNKTSCECTVSQNPSKNYDWDMEEKTVWIVCGSDATFCMALAAINHARQANKKRTKSGNAACLCGFWAISVYNHFSSVAGAAAQFYTRHEIRSVAIRICRFVYSGSVLFWRCFLHLMWNDFILTDLRSMW